MCDCLNILITHTRYTQHATVQLQQNKIKITIFNRNLRHKAPQNNKLTNASPFVVIY